MATQLWKDGKSEWFPAEYVARKLKEGWAPTNEPKKQETSKAKVKK